MLETPHVAVGAALASKIPNPLISIPLSFASHFVFERVPHWNPHLNTEMKKYGHITDKSKKIVIIDVALAILVGGVFAYHSLPNYKHAATILVSSLASVLPDVIEGPFFFLNSKSKFIEKWIKFQKSLQVDTTVFPGLITQMATIIAAIVWVF